MKTYVTDTTLVDLIMVCGDLPQDEIEQMTAFNGSPPEAEATAVQLYNSGGVMWTCRVKETGEPLVVAGYLQIGVSVWRSFMLARPKAWDEFGGEVTHHVREVIDAMAKQPNIRLETLCLATRERAQKWYERVGLTYESTLRNYGAHGEDAVMYVKTEQRVVTLH